MPAEPTLNSRRPIASHRRLSTWLLFGLMAFVSIIVARLACHLPARPMWTVKSAFPKGRTHVDETRGIIYQYVKTAESWQVIKFSLQNGRFLGAIPSTVFDEPAALNRHQQVRFSKDRLVLYQSAIGKCAFQVVDLDSETVVEDYEAAFEVTDILPSPSGRYVSEHTFRDGWQLKNSTEGNVVLPQIEQFVFWSPDEKYLACKLAETKFGVFLASSGQKIAEINFEPAIMQNAVSSYTLWTDPNTVFVAVIAEDSKTKSHSLSQSCLTIDGQDVLTTNHYQIGLRETQSGSNYSWQRSEDRTWMRRHSGISWHDQLVHYLNRCGLPITIIPCVSNEKQSLIERYQTKADSLPIIRVVRAMQDYVEIGPQQRYCVAIDQDKVMRCYCLQPTLSLATFQLIIGSITFVSLILVRWLAFAMLGWR